ncbi:MAG: hypothetical protein M3220_13775 [Chloroflexota bacterium]|nr:hypothetical protein [Chloroflexota bacterium]
MAVIDERLRDRIREAPREVYQVIVRTDGETGEVAEICRSRGMVVHRMFNLLPGLSVTAKGEALLELADNPHVKRIEADREVRAF